MNGRITGFSHTGVQVAHLGRSIALYEKLGLELAARWTNAEEYVGRQVGYPGVVLQIAVMSIPGSDAVLELLEYQGVERAAIDPGTANPGTGHFCLAVEDLEAIHARLKDEVEFLAPPQTPTIGPNEGGRAIYMKDPDGYRVEMLESPAR